MMAHVGPRLRNCSGAFEIAGMGSDMRLARRINRLIVNGRHLNNWDVHRNLRVINPFRPADDFHLVLAGQQLSFHNVPANMSIDLFDSLVTIIDRDSYFDWQSVAFQPLKIDMSAIGRVVNVVFGYCICIDDDMTICARRKSRIKQVAPGEFRQRFTRKIVVRCRCNASVGEGEIRYVGDVHPPEAGIVFEVRCPERRQFVKRGNGPVRVTRETASL
jgi:hypothetical protein